MIIYLLHTGQFKSQTNGGKYCANNGTKNTFRNNLLSPTPKPGAEFNNCIFLHGFYLVNVDRMLRRTTCIYIYMYSYLIICCIWLKSHNFPPKSIKMLIIHCLWSRELTVVYYHITYKQSTEEHQTETSGFTFDTICTQGQNRIKLYTMKNNKLM